MQLRNFTPPAGRTISDTDPIIVKFTAAFDDEEFWKLGRYATASNTTADPIKYLYTFGRNTAGATNRFVLDMSDATFTGLHTSGILGLTGAPAYNTTDNAGWVSGTGRNSTARDNLFGIAFPGTMRYIGSHLLRSSTGLRRVSLRNCSELEGINDSAFQGIGANFTRIDLTGCDKLGTIGRSAFEGSTAVRTWSSKGSTATHNVLDLSYLPNLDGINDRAFYATSAAQIHYPNYNTLFIGSDAFESSMNITAQSFHGKAQVDAGWRGMSWNLDTTSGPGGSATHQWERGNGVLGTATNWICEIYIPQQLTLRRTYKGFLQLVDDDGVCHGQEFIVMHPEKGDIYRGQSNMLIQARVHGAPGGLVDLFSRPDDNAIYKVGTMNGGWVTLSTPDTNNRLVLDNINGMQISLDPRDFNATPHGAITKSEVDRAVYNIDGVTRETGSGNNNWFWQPNIGPRTGTYTLNSARFIMVKSFFYKDENNKWNEIRRNGNDTWVDNNSFNFDLYRTDQFDLAYVWVSQDIGVRRIHRRSSGVRMSDMQSHGNAAMLSQDYWVMGHPEMCDPAKRNVPLKAGFYSVTLSLKQGWNQIEHLYRFTHEIGHSEFVPVEVAVRVSPGIMGPFSAYDRRNMEDFNVRSGKAFAKHHQHLLIPPEGPRVYSDEEYAIQVPWVFVE